MPDNLPVKAYEDIDRIPMRENFLSMVKHDPVLQSLAQLVGLMPGGQPIPVLATVVEKIVTTMIHRRERIFFEELKTGRSTLEEGVLQSEDFIHKFLITYREARKSAREEKIRYLARLLKASEQPTLSCSLDEYEELLGILEELSYRELSALAIVDDFYSQHPIKFGDNDKPVNESLGQYLPILHRTLEDKLGIKHQERRDFLIRLSRSQCYEPIEYLAGTSGDGYLTPLYYRLKRFIESV